MAMTHKVYESLVVNDLADLFDACPHVKKLKFKINKRRLVKSTINFFEQLDEIVNDLEYHDKDELVAVETAKAIRKIMAEAGFDRS